MGTCHLPLWVAVVFFAAVQNRAEKSTPFREDGANSLDVRMPPSVLIDIFVEGPCIFYIGEDVLCKWDHSSWRDHTLQDAWAGTWDVSCFQSHKSINCVFSPDFKIYFKGNYFLFFVGQQKARQDLNLFLCPKADRCEDNFFFLCLCFLS